MGCCDCCFAAFTKCFLGCLEARGLKETMIKTVNDKVDIPLLDAGAKAKIFDQIYGPVRSAIIVTAGGAPEEDESKEEAKDVAGDVASSALAAVTEKTPLAGVELPKVPKLF